MRQRLAECARRVSISAKPIPDAEMIAQDIDRHPAVDALRLPEIWLALAKRYGEPRYPRRAVAAAVAIRDRRVVALAQQQLDRIGTPC
ncbi:MAG: hypothetical protein ACYDAG_02370 [Chloroflexota bacterium]